MSLDEDAAVVTSNTDDCFDDCPPARRRPAPDHESAVASAIDARSVPARELPESCVPPRALHMRREVDETARKLGLAVAVLGDLRHLPYVSAGRGPDEYCVVKLGPYATTAAAVALVDRLRAAGRRVEWVLRPGECSPRDLFTLRVYLTGKTPEPKPRPRRIWKDGR